MCFILNLKGEGPHFGTHVEPRYGDFRCFIVLRRGNALSVIAGNN